MRDFGIYRWGGVQASCVQTPSGHEHTKRVVDVHHHAGDTELIPDAVVVEVLAELLDADSFLHLDKWFTSSYWFWPMMWSAVATSSSTLPYGLLAPAFIGAFCIQLHQARVFRL